MVDDATIHVEAQLISYPDLMADGMNPINNSVAMPGGLVIFTGVS